jgi:hypothetical protein
LGTHRVLCSKGYNGKIHPEVNHGQPQQLQPMGYANQGAQQSSSQGTVIIQQPVQRKMEVCLINFNKGKDDEGYFKSLQYSEMECNCVRKTTEGLFRKNSTL